MKIDNKLILENSKDLNILYVEDDKVLRETTAKLFSNFFNRVDIAIDGQDGLEKYRTYLEEEQKSYDIVISDINMPNLDGLEMCEQIRNICFDQAIIFVTAFNELNYLHRAISLGVNGFLTKPIEIEQMKKVLYTTSQFVSDRKLVKNHYEQIEEHNMLSINLQDAREFDSSKDIINDLILNKELISKIWTDKESVHERLQSHMIDVEYFRKHYAIKVIEYFLDVIKGDAKIGNCPVIFVMLDFFKNKDLALEDIFIICVQFKNTITSYILKRYSFNQELFDDFSLILDKNFEGVIINYLKLKGYIEKEETKVSVEDKVQEVTILEEINYTEYVLENDIYELQELEEDIDNLAISVVENSKSTIDDSVELGNRIDRYGKILSNYPLFSQLGGYVTKLGVNFVSNAQSLFDDREKMSNISTLLEGFVNDLIVWRKEIFKNNIENSHFLDSSFFSNVDTIIMFIEYDESAQSDESFDDDMFF